MFTPVDVIHDKGIFVCQDLERLEANVPVEIKFTLDLDTLATQSVTSVEVGLVKEHVAWYVTDTIVVEKL